MKLHATVIPYSGTAHGGGLRLVDENGRVRFFVVVQAADRHGVSKEQTAAIAGALINGIPDPIEVPD